MSHYDYKCSQRISAQGQPYYALIMAAIRDGDSDNREILRHAFPDTWDEFWARFNAPDGRLPGED
jgi:hypothetical protein